MSLSDLLLSDPESISRKISSSSSLLSSSCIISLIQWGEEKVNYIFSKSRTHIKMLLLLLLLLLLLFPSSCCPCCPCCTGSPCC